jgi:hypothetical protein
MIVILINIRLNDGMLLLIKKQNQNIKGEKNKLKSLYPKELLKIINLIRYFVVLSLTLVTQS